MAGERILVGHNFHTTVRPSDALTVQLCCIDPASSKLSHVATRFLVTGSLFVVAFGRGKAKPPGRGYNMKSVQAVLEEIRQEKLNQARVVLLTAYEIAHARDNSVRPAIDDFRRRLDPDCTPTEIDLLLQAVRDEAQAAKLLDA
jgi:hypothetical protein